jgi:hypothetical protein
MADLLAQVAIQRKNRDDFSAAADRLSCTLQRGETKTAKDLAQMQVCEQ